jgi:hypothetical protein
MTIVNTNLDSPSSYFAKPKAALPIFTSL